MDSSIISRSVPVQVKFRHMPKSREIRDLIRQQAERLRQFNLSGGRCEVVVDESNHWHRGRVYQVTVCLKVPGRRHYAARAVEEGETHEYLHAAVRLAFDEVERQLKKHRRRWLRDRANELAA